VLVAAPVLLCFLYFAVYAAGLVGLQSFQRHRHDGAVRSQRRARLERAHRLHDRLGGGHLAGGFIAARAPRHDIVAATGLALGAFWVFSSPPTRCRARRWLRSSALPGFSVGATGPSRDLIVRASTPPGATGRVYGFVYSGLDVGSLATPVFYGG